MVPSALVALDESDGTPSALLNDTADIQRLIANRHGVQRERLGWTSDMLAREQSLLLDEVKRVMHRCFGDAPGAPQFEEAIGIISRYLEQAGDTSRRALERAMRQASVAK